MTEKTIADKMYVKNARSIAVINAGPDNAALLAQLPAALMVAEGPADLVLLVAGSRAELEMLLPPARDRLNAKGALWVVYIKGQGASTKNKPELHRDIIREFADSIGLTSVGIVAIDERWSALRLKHS
jgi:hypothetical protein